MSNADCVSLFDVVLMTGVSFVLGYALGAAVCIAFDGVKGGEK